MECFPEAVEWAMRDNGLTDPKELIWGFMVLLREQHTRTISVIIPAAHDYGMESTGLQGRTAAESLVTFVRTYNKRGRELGLIDKEKQGHVPACKAVSDLLAYYLPVWNAMATDDFQEFRRYRKVNGKPLSIERSDPEFVPRRRPGS